MTDAITGKVKAVDLDLPGLKLVERTFHGDERGFFVEEFKRSDYLAAGLPADWVQLNHSRSQQGILRGLHYQWDPPMGKLIWVVQGAVFDVAVDVRRESPTFGKHAAVELTGENRRMLWVPAGFAHGFVTTAPGMTDVFYLTDGEYHQDGESGIAWDDPALGVNWPIKTPSLSDKDRRQKTLAEYARQPVF